MGGGGGTVPERHRGKREKERCSVSGMREGVVGWGAGGGVGGGGGGVSG